MFKIIIISIFVMLLGGCKAEIKDDFFAMDTYMSSSVFGSRADSEAVKSEIYRLDSLLRWDGIDTSDAEVKQIIDESEKLKEFTGGAFDIGVAPVLELWGFRNKKYKVPDASDIKAVLAEESNTVDFGGIGKGYAGEKVRELLLNRGVESAIISLGGNVQTVGKAPGGKPWRVGLQNPDGEGYFGYVDVIDSAVVTSGGYHRYFEAGGKKYSHIINPGTGYPAETDIKSVTVISSKGAVADALSTAFYVMGTKKTKELCEKESYTYNGISFAVVIMDSENRIYTFGDVDFERKG